MQVIIPQGADKEIELAKEHKATVSYEVINGKNRAVLLFPDKTDYIEWSNKIVQGKLHVVSPMRKRKPTFSKHIKPT